MAQDKLTFASVGKLLRAQGLTIRPTGYDSYSGREYRVNYRDGGESSAYYTCDLQDALDTGIAMAKHMRSWCAAMDALVASASEDS